MVGVSLPLKTPYLNLAVTEPVSVPYRPPVVLDVPNRFYTRSMGLNRMLVGYRPDGYLDFDVAESTNPDRPPTSAGLDWFADMARAAVHRFPPFADVDIVDTWGGHLTITPDAHPILGPVSEVDGFVLAVGMHGKGVHLVESVGRIVAEMILDVEPSVDISPLRYDRFERGETHSSTHPI
jgi:glycine/D-amino acid oxidase-like deaminating enzyme